MVGVEFMLVDCVAVVYLFLVSSVSKIIYGEDVLVGLFVGDYFRIMGA